MTQVSKYHLDNETYKSIFFAFLNSITKLRNTNTSDKFLREFLTGTEQIMLAKRFSVAMMLRKKYDYRLISKILRVSTGTIASVHNQLNKGPAMRYIIDKIIKEEKLNEFWDNISKIIDSLFIPGGAKASIWRKRSTP